MDSLYTLPMAPNNPAPVTWKKMDSAIFSFHGSIPLPKTLHFWDKQNDVSEIFRFDHLRTVGLREIFESMIYVLKWLTNFHDFLLRICCFFPNFTKSFQMIRQTIRVININLLIYLLKSNAFVDLLNSVPLCLYVQLTYYNKNQNSDYSFNVYPRARIYCQL